MLKCAFYEKEITPPLGFNMPGYFNFRPGKDVKDRLYAKAIVVANGKEKAAIVSVDTCEPEEFMRDVIVARVEKFTDIKKENIIFSVNHTHTGFPDGDSFVTDGFEEYIKTACDLMADCIILADMRLQECEVFYGIGKVDGIAFVRDYFMKSTTPRTNPGRLNPDIDKPVTDIDRDLPVLIFKDKKGNVLGTIISYACHQDCVGGDAYSGDFSSSLSYELKKTYGNDFVSIFMPGACGNINHFDVTKADDEPDHYINMGKIVAGEALKVIASAKPVCGEEIGGKFEILDLSRYDVDEKLVKEAEHVIATVKPAVGVKIAADGTDPDQYNLAMANILMKFVNGPKTIKTPLQTLRIGDFILYTFPGEIYTEYGKAIKAATKADKCLVATMCNKRIGYVPTRDMFYDTIYESLPGSCTVEKEGGYKMVDKLLQMGDDLLKS